MFARTLSPRSQLVGLSAVSRAWRRLSTRPGATRSARARARARLYRQHMRFCEYTRSTHAHTSTHVCAQNTLSTSSSECRQPRPRPNTASLVPQHTAPVVCIPELLNAQPGEPCVESFSFMEPPRPAARGLARAGAPRGARGGAHRARHEDAKYKGGLVF